MYNEYYYTEINQEPIYCSMIKLDNFIEVSLYRGNKLVLRKSLQIGKHQLKKDEFEIKVRIRSFNAVSEFIIHNELVSFKKLTRKQLKNKLIHHDIYNELNPRKLPQKPVNYKRLKTPVILLIIGISWDIFTDGKGKFWEIPAMIIYVVAYIQLFSPLVNKIPERFMNLETKSKFKFVIGILGMGITQTLVSEIMNL